MSTRNSKKTSAPKSLPTKDQARRLRGAASFAKTSARSTTSGPAHGPAATMADAATAKVAGTEAVAAAFPFNAAKPSEFGRAAMFPVTGQTIKTPHATVGGSTLTETIASEKIGRGNPQMSFNPSNASLDRVRVDSGDDWEMIGQCAKTLRGDEQAALKKAYAEVEDDEDEHLYHTKG